MIITNKYGLPQTFVNVVERPTYTKGKAHMSVTELLNSPQIVQLKAKYSDKIEVDVTDMIWAVFGTAVHHVLEQGKDPNHIVEQRLHAELDGHIDLDLLGILSLELHDLRTIEQFSNRHMCLALGVRRAFYDIHKGLGQTILIGNDHRYPLRFPSLS